MGCIVSKLFWIFIFFYIFTWPLRMCGSRGTVDGTLGSMMGDTDSQGSC